MSYEIHGAVPGAVIWSCSSVVWESCVIAGSQMKEVNEGKAASLLILCACAMSAHAGGITKTALGWQSHEGMAQSLCHRLMGHRIPLGSV